MFASDDVHDVNIRTVRSMTSSNLISNVCETRKFVMAILHGKQGLLCDTRSSPTPLSPGWGEYCDLQLVSEEQLENIDMCTGR